MITSSLDTFANYQSHRTHLMTLEWMVWNPC